MFSVEIGSARCGGVCSAEKRDFEDADDDVLISWTNVLAESGKLSSKNSCGSTVSSDAVVQEFGPGNLTVEQEVKP